LHAEKTRTTGRLNSVTEGNAAVVTAERKRCENFDPVQKASNQILAQQVWNWELEKK